MNTTATCIDFEKILFDDLTAEKPLRQILEHVRLRTGVNVFVLSCDYRPLLYSADQLLTAYFPHLYESGEDVICYMGDEAEQTALREIFHRQTAVVWRPSADDPFFTVFYPTGKEGQPMWLLAIKCSTEAQLVLAEQAAPLLASLCASQLADESSGAAALDGGVETTVARELIVFDSPASGSISLAQFKLQYGALLSGETMSRFCPPFSICAFRSRDPQQTEGDYTQALAEMKEHFPDSFSIVSRGTLYAFFYACDRSCFSELENFSYQFQLRAGLSDRFDTLEERHYFKKQARELLKIGEHTASSKYVFPFFENYTQLLLCNAADRFGAQAFVLSDVERLRELDAESGNNNMLQTLWQYSRCFNTPTAAAKALYVDRSTLHYRLKKISELMETDLDVPASAQALSASIWLREIYRFSDGADKQN